MENFYKYNIDRTTAVVAMNELPAVKVYNTKAKIQGVPVHNFYFRTEAAREQWITEFKNRYQSWEDMKAKRKADREFTVNPAKAGDILCNSWGYDQTNVDFYQVVAVGNKTVRIAKIASQIVEGSGYSHGMACEVIAQPDKFIGEVVSKKVSKYGDSYTVTLNDRHSADLWDGKPEYMSWYA